MKTIQQQNRVWTWFRDIRNAYVMLFTVIQVAIMAVLAFVYRVTLREFAMVSLIILLYYIHYVMRNKLNKGASS